MYFHAIMKRDAHYLCLAHMQHVTTVDRCDLVLEMDINLSQCYNAAKFGVTVLGLSLKCAGAEATGFIKGPGNRSPPVATRGFIEVSRWGLGANPQLGV